MVIDQADLLPRRLPRQPDLFVPAEFHAGRGDGGRPVGRLRLHAVHGLLPVLRAQSCCRPEISPSAIGPKLVILLGMLLACASVAVMALPMGIIRADGFARPRRRRPRRADDRCAGPHSGGRFAAEKDPGRRHHRVRLPGRPDFRHGARLAAGRITCRRRAFSRSPVRSVLPPFSIPLLRLPRVETRTKTTARIGSGRSRTGERHQTRHQQRRVPQDLALRWHSRKGDPDQHDHLRVAPAARSIRLPLGRHRPDHHAVRSRRHGGVRLCVAAWSIARATANRFCSGEPS